MGTPRWSRWLVLLVLVLAALVAPSVASAAPRHGQATAHLLVTGLQGGSGSTVGPDGALYVTEGVAGRITRVDPRTGATTTYASGLPRRIIGVGGAMDIAFLGRTAYVLVTLVGPDVGGSDVVGIYRVDGPNSFTVVADIGAFALAHPPATPFDVPTGLQYALQAYRGGFLVTDGHHNRVLWGHPRRPGHRAAGVRQHRPDRAGGAGRDHLHGRGRPGPPPARGRQGGGVPAQVNYREGGRVG
jgi:hypothetical protein